MGKRMITYLLVLGAVGYLFLMYIYPALSGLLIFVLLYPAAGIVYLIFAGRGLSARVKRLSDYGEKEQQMKVSIQVCRESSLWIGKCRILLEMEHAVSGISSKPVPPEEDFFRTEGSLLQEAKDLIFSFCHFSSLMKAHTLLHNPQAVHSSFFSITGW